VNAPACIADYHRRAQRRLPKVLYDYADGGSFGEITLKRNIEDLRAVTLRQRVLRDVSKVSLATTLLGQNLSMPVVLAPVGMGGMYARRGEVQAARAAHEAGVPFCLSTVSICAVEEVAASAKAPPWFQLYMMKDRGYVRALLQRAQAAGARVLILTVDLPVPGVRYRGSLTARLSLMGGLARALDGLGHPRWMMDVFLGGRPHLFGNIAAAVPGAGKLDDFWLWVRDGMDSAVTWNDVAWLRQHWSGPIVLKGILDAEDAREAVRVGADGIVVSNHGGRQLDSAPSSIAALPAIADAVGNDLTVLVDGGIRSGLDVLKALASGARGVLVGRAWLFALAVAGQKGVTHMLDIVRTELQTAMALTGCTDIRTADRTLLTD